METCTLITTISFPARVQKDESIDGTTYNFSMTFNREQQP
jgi:hypothetical protein